MGIDACPDLDSQRKRFLDHNWESSWALDMAEVYRSLPKDECVRYVVELLDEHTCSIFLEHSFLVHLIGRLSCVHAIASHVGSTIMAQSDYII